LFHNVFDFIGYFRIFPDITAERARPSGPAHYDVRLRTQFAPYIQPALPALFATPVWALLTVFVSFSYLF
jgi:hypothetical protein